MQRHRHGIHGRVVVALLAVGLLMAAMLPPAASADGAWLDDQSVTWNTPGMALPPPPASRGPEFNDPRCLQQARPPETDQDRAVAALGWTLYASYSGGWGIQVVRGLAGYDGMCRPLQYQSFVFVDGKFAGTLSPIPMDSRTDGALTQSDFYGPDRMSASYVRYVPQDALCCPSARSFVEFKIDRTPAGPVVLRENTSTQPTSAAVTPRATQPQPMTQPTGGRPTAPSSMIPAPVQIPPRD